MEKKLIEYESYLYILISNKMLVKWISGTWDSNIYAKKSESRLLFADGVSNNGVVYEIFINKYFLDGGSRTWESLKVFFIAHGVLLRKNNRGNNLNK